MTATAYNKKIRSFIKASTAIALTGVLAACGNTMPAQVVEIAPVINTSYKLPSNLVANIAVEDQRPSNLIGMRLDRIKGEAPLFLNDAQPALTQAMKTALSNMGVSQFDDNGVTFTVFLDRLDYKAVYENLLQKVDTSVAIRVRVDKDNQFYEGAYSTNLVDNFVSSPTAAENQAVINKLLAQSLSRAFADQHLIYFAKN